MLVFSAWAPEETELPRQDLSAFANVPSDQWLTGTVASIAPFGFFVTLSAGGDTATGLVHNSEVGDRLIGARGGAGSSRPYL
mmetsp:Transcript_13424/g.27947  ORF Transcript_13424/g.27947 Transcript_13424/m.27947 type:complete len:82 (+) Transcript_13424:544-789(+)